MKHIYYKNDFAVEITLLNASGEVVSPPEWQWHIEFTDGRRKYICSVDNGNANVVGNTIMCYLDNHKFCCGEIGYKFVQAIPDLNYLDGFQDLITPKALPIELWEQESDNDVNIQSSVVPAYVVYDAYMTAKANGYTGTAEEFYDALNHIVDINKKESERVEAEANRVTSEQQRVENFAAMESALTTATSKANTATTKAEEASKRADNSATAASQARVKATLAANGANAAAAQATQAMEKTNKATELANTATANANNSAVNAGNAATEANEAAKNANDATEKAKTATIASKQSAERANTAADNADVATSNATTATNQATTATKRANDISADLEAKREADYWRGAKGEKGDKGDTGAKGDRGEKGDQGERGLQGVQGVKGDDGVSPTVKTSKAGKVTTIEITDAQGTHTATVNDGDSVEIVQSTGTSTTSVMSQKAVSDAIAVEETRAKEAEENLDGKVTDLDFRTEGISNEVIKTGDDSISIEDNNGNEVFHLDENGLDAKNVKSNGKPVLTEHQDISSIIEGLSAVENKTISITEERTQDTTEEIIIGESETDPTAIFTSRGVKVKAITDLDGNPIGGSEDALSKYMDVNYNTSVLAPFLLKYLNKETDEFGQLTIHLCGDSIFGRQDKGQTWNPSNPEMSLTPDMNDQNESQPGYITGHFPPNAWEQLVCYRLIKHLQYGSANVKYYNHVASEITKVGTWNDIFPAGADCLRLCSNSTSGNSISLSFSGARFAKFIVSNYGGATTGATIKVEISDDGGSTYKTPSDAGIIESHANSGVSGEHNLLDLQTIKFAQLCWSGFDEAKSYILRVTHTNNSILRVWGFETWLNKRINVIDCAEGGNTASSQNDKPRRFWNSNSKPSLVIYELPYLNDLGTGVVSTSLYKSKAYLTTNPGASAADGTTYYCEDTGYYQYFGITASHGDYMSYSAALGKWVLGSQYLEGKMKTFYDEVKTSLERIKRIGIPILCIITHDSTIYTWREFSPLWGAPILRGLTKQLGFATIDLNAYQHDLKEPNSLTKAPADGTHLNDIGSSTYAELIEKCLPLVIPNSIGTATWDNGIFYGSASPGNVKFDGNIECCEIPKICVLDNASIVISNVTNTGFTASGNGSFNYMAVVNV